MRIEFSIIFSILVIILTVCTISSMNSKKIIGKSVAFFVCSIIPPVIGNLIIICSANKFPAMVGYYIYFLGMDAIMYAMLRFTVRYCRIRRPNKILEYGIYVLLTADVIQYAFNPIFHHAFDAEPIMYEGDVYFHLIPKLGQTYHRIVDYGIFTLVVIVFLIKSIRSVRIYAERYAIILLALIIGGIWETFYIFSGIPIDRSMIGFAVVGILVYFFALYYRPLRLLDRMLAGMASELPEALYFFDDNGQCIWANDRGIKLAGIADEDYAQAEKLLSSMFGELDIKGDDWSGEKELKTGTNTSRYYIFEKHTVPYSESKIAGSFLSIRDNTEEHIALRREIYNATHDALTGLYTKEHFYECISGELKKDNDKHYAVVYINVNNFKMINDIFGSSFGDQVLKEIAKRIKECSHENCIYGRIVGDIFGMFMPVDEFDDALIDEALGRFTVTEGHKSHNVLIHMGIYFIPDKSIEISVMFDRARIAVSHIKEDYQICMAYYDDKMREQVLWDQHISSQLADAIAECQIKPFLQPIVDQNGHPIGAEALCRWIHPTDGFLSPARFIPVLEHNGMIADVDRYMWKCACEILAKWKAEGRDQFISINISQKDFYFMDVVSVIKNLAEKYEIEPEKLRIEITESVMMDNPSSRIAILNEFKKAGFIVEMDDFGSGYSSLNMLQDMPVDVIKIDMGFLNKSELDERGQKILHNIMNMTRDLGIISLTEGVETNEQYSMLLNMGCRLFQGYHFAKPMPQADLEKWFDEVV